MESDGLNLTLRPFKLTDVDDFMLWAGDEQVTQFLRWKTIASNEEASSFIQNVCIPHPWRRSICIDDRSIGFISVYPGSGDDRCRADIGYAFARGLWGRGIATTALRIAVPQVFETFPALVRLQAFVSVENMASQRVLQKVGFQREGILRNYCYIKGKIKDLIVHSLLSTNSSSDSLEHDDGVEVNSRGNFSSLEKEEEVPAPMVGNGKGEVNADGADSKKLVFFGNVARVFDFEDLLRASAEVLGKGTFGSAYKAELEFGTVVAVKRLKYVTIYERDFREKIEAVGSMNHENLIPLKAYYFTRDEKLLVYDFMPMGSLCALLHGNKGAGKTPLNWEIRSGIALGAARGIEYLHSQGPNVCHGNIKSSNILLTKSYDAQVSDFGLAHLVSPTRVAGYRPPEVKVSHEADVYSFGVLLLELLTGKAPTHALPNEEGVDLPRWVQSVVREEWTSEVFDLELLQYQNVEDEMVQLLKLAVDCAAQYPDKRPTMSEVTRRIEELRRSSLEEVHEPQPNIVHDSDGVSSR